MDETTRNFLLALAFIAIVGSIALLEFQKAPRASQPSAQISPAAPLGSANPPLVESKTAKYPKAVELASPDGFLNLPAGKNNVTVGELVGKKVVLIDFWTYSCINCQRTTPFLNAWYEKYREKGLEIIGVHTPEFEFEKDKGNVQKAIKKFGIKYPVVQDNEYLTWSAYRNRYWPRKYLIDIDGFIVYDHIGEGGYEETEKKIQELLEERMTRLNEKTLFDKQTVSPTASGDSSNVGSPEIYFGASRNDFLANAIPGQKGAQLFKQPEKIELNNLYLVGEWNLEEEFAESRSAGAKIIFRYDAKNVFFVAESSTPVKIKLLRDGLPLAEEKGDDVFVDNGESFATISGSQLYKLVAEKEYGEHTLEIIAERPGVRAYTFTFG